MKAAPRSIHVVIPLLCLSLLGLRPGLVAAVEVPITDDTYTDDSATNFGAQASLKVAHRGKGPFPPKRGPGQHGQRSHQLRRRRLRHGHAHGHLCLVRFQQHQRIE